MALAERLGRLSCALGWHKRPFELEPAPPGCHDTGYLFYRLERCTRCGMVGRLDPHGNLTPVNLPELRPRPESVG